MLLSRPFHCSPENYFHKSYLIFNAHKNVYNVLKMDEKVHLLTYCCTHMKKVQLVKAQKVKKLFIKTFVSFSTTLDNSVF